MATPDYREPDTPFDPSLSQADLSVPVRQRVKDWAAVADRSPPLPLMELSRVLEVTVRRSVVVAFSHDDYERNLGGIQVLIADEQRAFERAGHPYLHVSPAAPLPILADPVPAGEFRVGLRLDGAWLGVALFSDLVDVIAGFRKRGTRIDLVFHHLLGHVPELALEMVSAAGRARPMVWVHDFFTLCPNFTLLKNDAVFCGAPPVNSGTCATCTYGAERKQHAERMRVFFQESQPIVFAPSEAALDFWRSHCDLACAEVAVLPHVRMILAPSSSPNTARTAEIPLRIAHLGARLYYKGWHVFQELAKRFSEDERYAFFHLGAAEDPSSPPSIRNIPVHVNGRRRFAMVEAVAEARIDVVIHWSLCFETFSFSTFEALAGGAFIVLRSNAGNVGPAIEANAPDQGCAVAHLDDLFELFASGGLREFVAAAPKRRGMLIAQGGTAQWLLARPPIAGVPLGITWGREDDVRFNEVSLECERRGGA